MSIQIFQGVSEEGVFTVTADVDATEYAPEMEYRLNFAITDAATKRILHQCETAFTQETGATARLSHDMAPNSYEDTLQASASVFARSAQNQPWKPIETAEPQEYTLFGSAKCMEMTEIELWAAFCHDERTNAACVRVAAQTGIAMKDGYELAHQRAIAPELEYFVSERAPVKLVGRIDGDAILFDKQTLPYLPGEGPYFLLTLKCLVRERGGLTLSVTQITDSRNYK